MAIEKVDMESLYTVLIHCFFLISSGFAVIKLKYCNESENKGLRFLLLYFLTPAMLINSLILIQFASINWRFMVCIFATKAVLFVSMAGITVALSQNLAKAGLYAILVTQGNDLAIGYPVVDALYGKMHPEFTQYLYLAMPISLVVLNPIGFAMIEIQKCLDKDTKFSRRTLTVNVIKSMTVNPLVVATILGIFGNVLCKWFGLSKLLATILNGYSSAYVTVALFVLGCSLTTDSKRRREYQLVTPVLLMLVKSLLLPMLLREVAGIARVGQTDEETELLSIFGFFYGCLPSAPTVIVYATYANVAIPQISQSIALGTFMTGPWIFLTAQMVLVRHLSVEKVQLVLNLTKLTIGYSAGVLGLCVTVWLFWIRKFTEMPHSFVLAYSTTTTCLSLVAGLASSSNRWANQISWFDYYQRLAVWVWAAVLSFSLFLIRTRSLCFLLLHFWKMLATGIILPLVFFLFVYLFSSSTSSLLPTWIELLFVTVCVIVTVICLIEQHRRVRNSSKSVEKMAEIDIEDVVLVDPSSADESFTNDKDEEDGVGNADGMGMQLLMSAERNRDLETRMCGPGFRCFEQTRRLCRQTLSRYDRINIRCQNTDSKEPMDQWNESICHCDLERLLTIIAVACVAMVVRAFILSWRILAGHSPDSGLFAQLLILDTIFTYGQSICIWACFGVAWERLGRTILKILRKWRYGSEKLQLPIWDDLDEKTKIMCRGFEQHCLLECKQTIAKTVRLGFGHHRNVFSGSSLVDWLVSSDLAHDRMDGLKFGRRLVLGGLIIHIGGVEHLHDSCSLYYRFAETINTDDDEGLYSNECL